MVLAKKSPLESLHAEKLRPGFMFRLEVDDIPVMDSHMVLARVLSVSFVEPLGKGRQPGDEFNVVVVTDSGTLVLRQYQIVYSHFDLYSEAWQKAQFDDPAPSSEDISELVDFVD